MRQFCMRGYHSGSITLHRFYFLYGQWIQLLGDVEASDCPVMIYGIDPGIIFNAIRENADGSYIRYNNDLVRVL
jgi:hypothetical protein